MICIFCLVHGLTPSAEHVIPKALGGGMVIHDLCVPCNSRLGQDVDCELTDHLLMQFKRSHFRLAGNGGTVPDMMRLLLNGRGTWQTDGKEHIVHVKASEDKGVQSVYMLPKIEVEYDAATGAVTINANMDGSDREFIRKRLTKAMDEKGVPKHLQEQVFAQLQPTETSEQPTVNYTLRFGTADRMRRPIAKIAYELAFHWFGPDYLDHARADELRRFILEGTETTDIDLLAQPELLAKFAAYASPASEHVALITGGATGLVVQVKLFDVIVGVVRVTSHADGYFPMPYKAAMRFDVTTRTHRELNLIEFSAPYDRGSAMLLEQLNAAAAGQRPERDDDGDPDEALEA